MVLTTMFPIYTGSVFRVPAHHHPSLTLDTVINADANIDSA